MNLSNLDLKKAYEERKVLQIPCFKCDQEGNLHLKFDDPNIQGIIRRNDITYLTDDSGQVHKGFCYSLIDVHLRVLVKSFEEKDGKLFVEFDRKTVVEKIKMNLISKLSVGKVVTGYVKAIQKLGVFVDIGGDVQGLIPSHLVDITSDMKLKRGDKIECVVDKLQIENNEIKTIGFDRKKYLFSKIGNISDYISTGDVLSGIVTHKISTGLFVKILDKFDVLVDFNDEEYKKGEKVKVKIKKINEEHKKLTGILV